MLTDPMYHLDLSSVSLSFFHIFSYFPNSKFSNLYPTWDIDDMGPSGGADFRFCSPQPDTSLHCETNASRMVCLFTHRAVFSGARL